MLTILRKLTKSTIAILFVIILLFIQAYSDLSLPAYTSNIVNIGILQGGIDNTAPEVIRASQLDKLLLFVDQENRDTILSHYSLLDKSKLSQKDLDIYLDKYPLLSDEALYIWDGNQEDILKDLLIEPILISTALEYGLATGEESDETLENIVPPELGSSDMDIFTMLENMSDQVRKQTIIKIKDQIKQMPDSIKEQTLAHYIKAEYESIGVNVGRIQSKYILIIGLKMLGLSLLAMAASILVTLVSSRIAARMGRDLRNDVFKKVLSFSNNEMDKFSTASLITRSTNDIQQIQMSVLMIIRIVVYSPILALGGIIKILNTNSSMTWTLGVGVGAVSSVVLLLLIVAMPKFKLMQKLVDKVNLALREVLTGLPVIRAFSNEKHEDKRFDQVNTDLTKNSLFIGRVMTL